MLCIPCLAGINPLRLQAHSSNPSTPIQEWAQHKKKRTIVLDVENSPGVAACGLGAHFGCLLKIPAAPVDQSSGSPRRCNSPVAKALRTFCGSNIDQEVSKVGKLGRETELWAIQRSIRRWKFQSLLEGSKAPRLVHTLTCQGQGWVMEEKCLLTDLVPPSPSRIIVSKNSQPVTYL